MLPKAKSAAHSGTSDNIYAQRNISLLCTYVYLHTYLCNVHTRVLMCVYHMLHLQLVPLCMWQVRQIKMTARQCNCCSCVSERVCVVCVLLPQPVKAAANLPLTVAAAVQLPLLPAENATLGSAFHQLQLHHLSIINNNNYLTIWPHN